MSEVTEHAAGVLLVATRGPVALAIAALAEVVGRRVVVLGDDDPEGTPRERLAAEPPGPQDAVVVTDHDAPEAYDLLRDAVASGAGYVAMLASRTRTADVLTLLREEGVTPEALERVHLPAGLDVGGKGPGDIALSVVAEIAAWSNGRTGRPMREGPSPRAATPSAPDHGDDAPERSAEPAADFAGEPDGFDRLWTPHRMAYVRGERPTDEAGDGCPFCAAPGRGDVEGLVVHRGEHCYVVMNLFPYNPGHVLVCPYRHVSLYVDLTDDETTEFTALTKQAVRAIDRASSPMGYNLGMNQGAVAGAGVAAHLHQHVVPRWGGDSNFLPIVARTKALPMLLEDVRTRLVDAWPHG